MTPRLGRKYGKLTVVDVYEHRKDGNNRYLCSCECGGTKITSWQNLARGDTKSCGCLRNAPKNTLMPTKHSVVGVKKHPLYETYRTMLRRCYEPGYHNYAYYGGVGVTVCQAWREDFWSFAADMGDRPDGTSIDRVDTGGNYEPGNCRWATSYEQATNRKNTTYVLLDGVRMPTHTAARALNVDPDKLVQARKLAATPADALARVLACAALYNRQQEGKKVNWGPDILALVPKIRGAFAIQDV